MMKINLFLIVLCLFSCDLGDDRLRVVNTTNSNYLFTYVFEKDNIIERLYQEKELNANDSFVIISLNGKHYWDYVFSKEGVDSIYFFFINLDSLKRYSLKEIYKNQNYEMVKAFSHDDLVRNNYQVIIE